MNRLKVAVIGFGVMGQYHASNYAALPGAELVAAVDPDPLKRSVAEEEFGCRTYADVSELLSNEEISAVTVAAPTSQHFAVTRLLLEAGVHALVEKPLAPSVEQAAELVRLSRANDVVLQVGHITRFYEAVRRLNSTVTDPFLIEARRMTTHTRIRDAGVILDLMIHDIDILLKLVPSAIATVSVAGHSLDGNGFEDVAAAQIVFDNGCIARLLASRVAYSVERTMSVMERDKSVTLDFSRDPHTEIAIQRPAPDDTGTVRVERFQVEEDNPLRRELSHFLARINRAEAPVGTAEDDLRSLAVATRLLEHMRLTQLDELENAFLQPGMPLPLK